MSTATQSPEEARGVSVSMGDERKAASVASQQPDEARRLQGVREAYMTTRVLGVLLPRLESALDRRGLRCEGCPVAERPPPRDVTWNQYQPYLLAHVWPDPVVTPTDDDGKAVDEPRVSVHICGGINGVTELSTPDVQLTQAGYLGAFHTALIRDRVTAFIEGLSSDEAYKTLKTDDARTNSLREQIGVYLLADTKIRSSVCATLEQYMPDTGVTVNDCE